MGWLRPATGIAGLIPCVMGIALIGVSVPNFWLAILSVVLFSVTLGWLPFRRLRAYLERRLALFISLLQPAMVLALFQIGYLARMTRSEMLEVLDQDFIRTARAKGVSETSNDRQTCLPQYARVRDHRFGVYLQSARRRLGRNRADIRASRGGSPSRAGDHGARLFLSFRAPCCFSALHSS